MHPFIKNLLEKCNLAYSNGEFYTLSLEDTVFLEKILDICTSPEEVTDQMYDVIYATAKDMWPDDPFFNKLTSENTGYGVDITHDFPMGSMDELKEGDFAKWSKGHEKFMISDKLDGCSLVLTYERGKLKVAATRGRGFKGKDVTRHINFVPNVPKTIKYPDKIIIRGELLFKKADIEPMMDQVELLTGKRPRNGRNTISGLLTRKESYEDLLKKTNFVAYWTSTNQGLSFEVLKSFGFEVPSYQAMLTEELTDENMTNLVETRLKNSEYELDGIILTQMDNIEEGFVGSTINPKCSRKFKIGIYDNEAESVVTNINWQISRWGVFTPVLEIEPVEICGCTVSNITAHNYTNVLATKCGIGSRIRFKRAGLVIPKLEEVLEESEDYNLPNCKTRINGVDLVFDEDDEVWYNDPELGEFVWEKDLRALEYFGQKLEIDQLGGGNCAKLYSEYSMEYDWRLTPVDIFNLTDEFIINTIGKNGEKIVASLKAKKSTLTEVKFAAAVGAFGPDMGEHILQRVYDKYGRLDNITEAELSVLDDFAESRINQYLEWQDNWTEIKNYVADFLTFVKKEVTSDKFSGQVVCFSGIRDKDLTNYINTNGGQASDNWTKNVTCLILKDKNSTSSKADKARKAGIEILSLEEAYERFGFKR